MALKIKDVKFIERQGHALIQATVEGVDVLIPGEQKAFADYGLVFMGSNNQAKFKATLPADPSNGRKEDRPLEGFTDDEQIQALYAFFAKQLNEGTFQPGRVDLGEVIHDQA